MFENIVNEYGWASSKKPNSCGYITPCILDILNKIKVKRVCDLGSGNGALCSHLALSGYDAVGVEYDGSGVEIAIKLCPNVPFYRFGVQDDPDELLKSEQIFDAVISTEVIEHLFSPHLLPMYSSKILREGGYLIVSTPYHGYLKNLALSIANAWDKHHTPLWHGGHVKFWSRKTLTQLLADNGFAVTDFFGVGRFPYLWKSMVLVARKI